MNTILRWIRSNAFMTSTWYGYPKTRNAPLLPAIVVSRLLILFGLVARGAATQ
jgi:uncharacterized protein (DUF486 family)